MAATPVSMEVEQRQSFSVAPVKQSICVEEVNFALPHDRNITGAMLQVIAETSADDIREISNVQALDVSAERLFDRNGIKSHGGIQSQGLTYLFMHGGMFYKMQPAGHRSIEKIILGTSARCVSVDYRLSPQNPFPAPLIDLLVVYMGLIYPSPECDRAPLDAGSICLCGDSCGGNFPVAFLQLSLHWQKKRQRIRYGGRYIQVPFPGAVAIHSGYMDLTRSLPSETANLSFDVIPSSKLPPYPADDFVQDSIWPCDPPRHHVYAPDALLMYPFVSPTAATDWSTCSTPVLMNMGQECLADGNIAPAKAMDRQGVRVKLEIYQGMSHNFLARQASTTQGETCAANWKHFLHAMTDPEELQNEWGKATIFEESGERRVVPIAELEPNLSMEELSTCMSRCIESWGPAPTRYESSATL